jgi:hypothetical protein
MVLVAIALEEQWERPFTSATPLAEKGQPPTILAQERSPTGHRAVVECRKRPHGCWVKESRHARHAGTHPHDLPP